MQSVRMLKAVSGVSLWLPAGSDGHTIIMSMLTIIMNLLLHTLTIIMSMAAARCCWLS